MIRPGIGYIGTTTILVQNFTILADLNHPPNLKEAYVRGLSRKGSAHQRKLLPRSSPLNRAGPRIGSVCGRVGNTDPFAQFSSVSAPRGNSWWWQLFLWEVCVSLAVTARHINGMCCHEVTRLLANDATVILICAGGTRVNADFRFTVLSG